MDIRFVYMTAANVDEAKTIGRELVESRLAACVNILPQMHSIYRWEGKIEDATEVVMVAKTTAAHAAGADRAGEVAPQLRMPLHRQPEGGRRVPALPGLDHRERVDVKQAEGGGFPCRSGFPVAMFVFPRGSGLRAALSAFSCGRGFPAATIEAESPSHKKTCRLIP